MLGADCFETRHTARLREQADSAGITEDSAYTLGQIAKIFADSCLMDQYVIIVRDMNEENFDTYGRLLRHVFIKGKSFSELLRGRGLLAPDIF